jgi:hypothetical protein
MAYKARITDFIGAQESVYGDSPAGNLDTKILVGDMHPLRQAFDSDSKTRLPVTIHDLITFFASEQRIVLGIMPVLSHSTAMATPFARMPAIHDIQSNIIVEASLFEYVSELKEWDSHDFSIESLSFGTEFCELFDCNIGIEPLGNYDYLHNHLTEISFDKILFSCSQSLQLPESLLGLKHSSPFHYFFPLNPDILAEISLIQNFAFGTDNADGEMLGVDINTENIIPMDNLLLLGQVCDNLAFGSQPISLANPFIRDKRTISLPVSVLPDGNGNPFSRIHSKFNEEVRLRAECLAIPRAVELHDQSTDFLCFLIPDISLDVANDLTIKRGVHLAG